MRYLPDSPILCGLWISPLIFFIILFLCFFPHLLCQFTHQIHRSCAVPDSPILCGLWISTLIFFIIFFLCFFVHLVYQFTHQIHRSCAVSEFLPSSSSSSFFVLGSSTPLSIYPTNSPILLLSKYKWLPPPFKMPPSSSSSEKLLSALPCLAVSSWSSNMRHR